jgi:hypothetical protein
MRTEWRSMVGSPGRRDADEVAKLWKREHPKSIVTVATADPDQTWRNSP